MMMNAYNRFDQHDDDSDEEYSDSGYDSDEWEEGSARRQINFSLEEEEN